MSASEMLVQSRSSASKRSHRVKLALEHGLYLAEMAGRQNPTLRDGVWELLMEAADTLKRLPNREKGWLTASSRAHWPEMVREFDSGTRCRGAGGPRLLPASAEAIDRMDEVLLWLAHAAGVKPQRDIGVLFGLACGVKVAFLRERYGCARRTVYDIRDRALARLCFWLEKEFGSHVNLSESPSRRSDHSPDR